MLRVRDNVTWINDFLWKRPENKSDWISGRWQMISRSIPAEGCGEMTCSTQSFHTDRRCGPALFFIALKWLGTLMVIICGDRLPLIDAISPCWYTGDEDSAFSHTSFGFCWALISDVPICRLSYKIYIIWRFKKKLHFKKKKKSFLKPHFLVTFFFFLSKVTSRPNVLQLVILSVIFIRVHCIDLQRYRLHVFFDT